MDGEKYDCTGQEFTNWGSPPHGRGKGVVNGRAGLLVGITPAWAGKRRCTAACNGLCWDHPRVGGEKLFDNGTGQGAQGSPPRGRGKVTRRKRTRTKAGITPAWAGKSHAVHSPSHGAGDHPRVGGEKLGSMPWQIWRLGSPPRGRGKVEPTNQDGKEVRITPA